MAEFNMAQDWKYIQWSETVKLVLIRGFGAGIVLAFLMFTYPVKGQPQPPFLQTLATPLVWPIFVLCFAVPIGLGLAGLSRMGVPFTGLFSFMCNLIFVMPGDPLVWLFNLVTGKRYLPVEDFGFLNFALIIFVLDEKRRDAAMGNIAAGRPAGAAGSLSEALSRGGHR